MPRSKVDPVDRIIDDYQALDATQRAVFAAVIKRLKQDCPVVEQPKRGRPAGSRNKSNGMPAGVNAAQEIGL